MSIPLPALGINPPQQQNPLGSLSQLMALKSQMGQQQIQQGQIQEQQQALQIQAQKVKDQKTVTQLFVKNNGDLDQTIADAAKAGVTPETLQALQLHAIDVKGKTMDLVTKQGGIAAQQADLMQGAHATVAAASDTDRPQVYQQQLIGLQKAGVDVSKMPLQYPGDDAFKILGATVQGYKAQIEQALKATEGAKNTAQAGEANAAAAEKQTAVDWYKAHGGAPGVPVEAQQQADWLAKNPDKGPADYKKYTATMVPAYNFNLQNTGTTGPAADVAKRFGMTPVALDQAAEKYWTSGVLPPAGRGGPALALNKALMNRAAELHPEGSLAENSAEYAANKASLGKLQTNFDQVSAFEKTAGKNMDLFIDKLSKIPDLGVKFANVPLRSIDASMIGSDNYQAMKAAQQTASAEAAKVLGSANASGVLSDSQKKDAEDMLSGNLSYSAAKAVVATLHQDFANRHQSYQEQLVDIKKRLGGSSQPAPTQGGDFFSNFGGKPR